MKKNKGFTMIELLATIIILALLVTLGIISIRSILDRGDDSYYKSQEDMLILAGREYFADHRSELPKKVGDTASVTLETLIDEKYIDPIKDDKDNPCNHEKSNVTVQKITDRDYQYYGILKCDNEYETKEDESSPTITFTPNEESSTESITVKINITDNIGVASYRYVITKDGETYFDSEYQSYNGEETIDLTEIGLYKITGYAIDINGNRTTRESGEYSVYRGIDCSGVNFSSNVNVGTWTNQNINVTIDVPDNTYRMELSKITNGVEEPINSYIGNANQSLTLNTEGTHQIKAVLYDSNGYTCTTTTKVYYIDKTKPTVSYNYSGKTYKVNSLQICATASDNTGIRSIEMQVYKNKKVISSVTKNSTTSLCYTLSGEGSYTVYTRVYDVASNKQSVSPENPNGFYHQNYTLQNPKTVSIINNNYAVCPEDREIPNAQKCLRNQYNTMYVKNIRINGMTVTLDVTLRMNNVSSTYDNRNPRIICIANTSNVCITNLKTISIKRGWLGAGETVTYRNLSFNASSFAAGDYRIILDGNSPSYRFKTSSGMKNTIRVTG